MNEGGGEITMAPQPKTRPIDLVLNRLKNVAEPRKQNKLESQNDKQIVRKLEDIAAELQASTEPYRYGNSPPFIVDLPTKDPQEVFSYLTLLHQAGIPAQITDKLSIVGISLSADQTKKLKEFVLAHPIKSKTPFVAFGTPRVGIQDPDDHIGTTVIEQDGVVDIGASHAMLALFRAVSQNREQELPWGGSVAMVRPGTNTTPLKENQLYFERKNVGYIYTADEPDESLYDSKRHDLPPSMTSVPKLSTIEVPAHKHLYNCDTIASTEFAANSPARSLSARLKGNLTLNNTLKRALTEYGIQFTDISTYGESQLLLFDSFADIVHADRLVTLLYTHIKPFLAPTAEHTIVPGETTANTRLHVDVEGKVIYAENLPSDKVWSELAEKSKKTYPPVRAFRTEQDGSITITSVGNIPETQSGITVGHTPLKNVVISGSAQ